MKYPCFSPEELKNKKVVVGFDGFVDSIVQPIRKNGDSSGIPKYFKTMTEFGTYIADHSRKNCSIELDTSSRRFGGNAPILANALADLGADVLCVGTLDDDSTSDVFQNMACRKISYGKAGISLALEFQDGKILLGQTMPCREPAWKEIKSRAPKIHDELTNAWLIAMVNWSELTYMDTLLSDIYRECFSGLLPEKKKVFYFDLADVTRRSDEEILSILKLISCYAEKRYTVLGLNANEYAHICSVLGIDQQNALVSDLLKKYAFDEVLIHTQNSNHAYCASGAHFQYAFNVNETPCTLTGAGDHFNAGYCAGLLLGIPPEHRLQMASVFASDYISRGETMSLEELLKSVFHA